MSAGAIKKRLFLRDVDTGAMKKHKFLRDVVAGAMKKHMFLRVFLTLKFIVNLRALSQVSKNNILLESECGSVLAGCLFLCVFTCVPRLGSRLCRYFMYFFAVGVS